MESKQTYNFGIGLAVGVLALFAGLILVFVSPVGPWYLGGTLGDHVIGHYLGTSMLIIFGLIGLAFYRTIGRVGISVSILSIIMGIVYILEIPGLLFNYMQPHAEAMDIVSALQVLWGIIGIGGALLFRRHTHTTHPSLSTKTQ